MNTNENLITNWQTEHALSYLLLSVANSDCDIDTSELLEIKNILYPFTKSDEVSNGFLKDVLLVINKHDFEQKKEIITLLKSKFFDDKNFQKELLADIEEIIIADMNIQEKEMDVFHFVKRLFKED